MNWEHEKIFSEPSFQQEYDEWLSGSFRKKPLMVRIKALEKQVEKLCQQVEKLNSRELDDWNRSKKPL
jgi:hypothetical protein